MAGESMPSWSLQGLPAREVMQVGGGVAAAGAPLAWVAPGTTLGVRGFVATPSGGDCAVIDCASAYAMLHSHEFDEAAILEVLRHRGGTVCAGDVLSADGLVGLHRAICALRGVQGQR